MALKPFPLLVTGVGSIILYSGITGKKWTQVLTNTATGKTPQSAPSVNLVSYAYGYGTGSGSNAPNPTAPGAIGPCTTAETTANQKLGKRLAAAYGWGSGAQWAALNGVVMLESGWCNTIQNPNSSAYGIGQFLSTTWASVGYTESSNPTTQINAMLAYIKQRYGTPVKAYAFHIANGYY
jgi:hypothetical protein